MSEKKAGIEVGNKVRFSVGRARTSYEGTVDRFEGAFAVTKDKDGKERKVRPGACMVL